MIEVKSTTNKDEMISNGDLNRKALQELLLYYLEERVTNKNDEIKHLIVTNTREFFIFDAHEFERKFYSDKELLREYGDFSAGRKSGTTTGYFYTEIAAKYIEAAQADLEYTHVDLNAYQDTADNSPKLAALYKLLSDTHLLKLPFQNDSNSLNKGFYNELLHIIGVEEKKVDTKTLILRKSPDRRNWGSLLEMAIDQLESTNLHNIPPYGDSGEERLFNVALELCITWTNRILFIKLLEAQMLKYHHGDSKYKILTTDKIKDFDTISTLFFNVLARDISRRKKEYKTIFEHVPYLNSSLFEQTPLELYCRISDMKNNRLLPIPSGSVLRNSRSNLRVESLPTCEYLLRFLDAYDFSGERGEEVRDEAKTLINASVLGLIFEKINGHKDGSVFTPGFITMFICRESIERTILRKFNERFGWSCATITDLYNNCDGISIKEANKTFDGVKICDPAVGSGHFLVSALNELIRLKFELGILADKEGNRIRKSDYTIGIDNDELAISESDGQVFSYNPQNAESRRMQETLFNEKRRTIENCLFGVDINPNSVNICRLRLWIELLKNAYYTAESGYTRLETLPNIDINIKCGNSLIHRFALSDGIKRVLTNTDITVDRYRKAVAAYKASRSKEEKHNLEELINGIKSKLSEGINIGKLQKERSELAKLKAPVLPGFKPSKEEKEALAQKIKKQEEKVRDLERKQEEFRSNKVYAGAFEWRLEFPEILDDDGGFKGFDLVVGNPPYIQLQSMSPADKEALKRMGYSSFDGNGDICCLFYEQGMNILRPDGFLCYITSNKWMRAKYGKNIRKYFTAHTNPVMLIDFAGVPVFDSVTVEPNILLLQKSGNKLATRCRVIPDKNSLNDLSGAVRDGCTECGFSGDGSWVILSPIEQSIKRKIEAVGTPLKDWDINIYRGVLTGYNEAFIISTEKRNEILANCQSEDERTRTAELIRPILRGRDIKRYGYDWANLWIIATFPSRHYDIEQYPAVKQHLLSFGKERLEQTGKTYSINGEKVKARKKTNNKWFETQDSISYWEDFSKPKIVWGEISDRSKFAYEHRGIFIPEATTFLMVGEHLPYLFCILNSPLSEWFFSKVGTTTGVGTARWKKYTIQQLILPGVSNKQLKVFNDYVGLYVKGALSAHDFAKRTNADIYRSVGLTDAEIEYVENYYSPCL